MFEFILGLILSYLMSLYFHKKSEKKLIDQFKSKPLKDQINRIIDTAKELKILINSYSLGDGSWWADEAHMKFSLFMDLFIMYIECYDDSKDYDSEDYYDEAGDHMDIDNILGDDKEDYEQFMLEIARELWPGSESWIQISNEQKKSNVQNYKKIFGNFYIKCKDNPR